ncbi:MAG: DNA double-strand break repair nuclease NurA [Elainellaceae cyanobacterium]
MPIKPSQIHDILNAKRDDFQAFNRETWNILQKYRASLATLAQWSGEKIETELSRQAGDISAKPLESLSNTEQCIVPFKFVWQNREQSLAWVRDRLTGITTFAVDGSQIFPGKDISIPVALVQVGWFENLHLPSGGYEKDIELDIMTPTDLQAGNTGEPVDRTVNFRRFEMEVQRLIQYMREHPNRTDCLVFFDGSLVGTFADAFDYELKQKYIRCFLELLRASSTYRVPLVGYVDTSRANDLTGMLQQLFKLPDCPAITDPLLINEPMDWGDRTSLFLCQRAGIRLDYKEQRDQIAFTYLKTTREGYPARIEVPLWMYEAGLLPRVMDWVRGEVIIGSGYPYVIETADQTAVLQAEDRQAFFKILQDWAETEDIQLRFSRKMISKVRRR